MLAIVPEHPAARQARTRAWQQIAAIGPSAGQWPARGVRGAQAAMDNPRHPAGREPFGAGAEDKKPAGGPAAAAEGIVWLGGETRPGRRHPLPSPERHARPVATPRVAPPARPMARVEAAGPKGRFLLWVDGVGGYLVCMDDRIVLGRAGPDSHADIPLMGDLSRNHATLRNGEGYLLQAHQASFVNGKPVVDQVVLHDGDVIRLGSTVELEFRQPSPVSATARLSIVSRHRLPLAVDGVLLMAETCIIGKAAQATSRPPRSRSRSSSIARPAPSGAGPPAPSTWTAEPVPPAAPLTLHSSVLGDGFSFSLEPLGSQNGAEVAIRRLPNPRF